MVQSLLWEGDLMPESQASSMSALRDRNPQPEVDTSQKTINAASSPDRTNFSRQYSHGVKSHLPRSTAAHRASRGGPAKRDDLGRKSWPAQSALRVCGPVGKNHSRKNAGVQALRGGNLHQ